MRSASSKGDNGAPETSMLCLVVEAGRDTDAVRQRTRKLSRRAGGSAGVNCRVEVGSLFWQALVQSGRDAGGEGWRAMAGGLGRTCLTAGKDGF